MSFSFNVVQISGQSVVVASGAIVVVSGQPVVVASGTQVNQVTPTALTGNIFHVGSSGTQFPPSAGVLHKVRMMASGIIFLGGDASVNSGVGFMLAGDPTTNPLASVDIEVNNLNKVYGISLTSGAVVSYLSVNNV